MRLLTFHCRQAQHDRCPANPPSLCTCHPAAAAALTEEFTVTEVLDQAANVIRERLDEINEELARYDDLRTERKELEAALKRLTPKERSARGPRSTNGEGLGGRITELVGDDEWTTAEIASALEEDDTKRVANAINNLCRDGKPERVARGIYKAA